MGGSAPRSAPASSLAKCGRKVGALIRRKPVEPSRPCASSAEKFLGRSRSGSTLDASSGSASATPCRRDTGADYDTHAAPRDCRRPRPEARRRGPPAAAPVQPRHRTVRESRQLRIAPGRHLPIRIHECTVVGTSRPPFFAADSVHCGRSLWHHGPICQRSAECARSRRIPASGNT